MKWMLLFFLSFSSYGWTLNNEARTGFPVSEIKIEVASNTCSNFGKDEDELFALVERAVDDYWNKVPSSSLELTVEKRNIDVSSATSLTAIASNASKNAILIGCNSSISNFSNGNIYGVGGIACTASSCQGAVALNNASSTNFDEADDLTQVSTVAHEIGHALGLGHSSVEYALMYYSVGGKKQEYLSQDDIDGISWLYPAEKKIGGLGGSCATIESGNQSGRFNESLMILLMILLIGSSLLRRFNFHKL